MIRRPLLSLLVLTGLRGAETATVAPETPALAPAASLAKLHLPPGFTAEIVAAEPLTLDPVAFDWDARGRLWVVEMADYPVGLENKGLPGGRVRVLEDTDGDGRYDKGTVFADKLGYPTGLLTWRDGVIVTAAPEILFLRDTNGDGRADSREVLIGGLQETNTQLRANGLHWGLDNWVHVAAGSPNPKRIGLDTRLRSLRAATRRSTCCARANRGRSTSSAAWSAGSCPSPL